MHRERPSFKRICMGAFVWIPWTGPRQGQVAMLAIQASLISRSLVPNRGAHRHGNRIGNSGGMCHFTSIRRGGHWSPARRRAPAPFAFVPPSEDGEDIEGGDDGTDADGVYRVNLKDLEGASRRSLLVSFTCNACGGRSERLVNPLAWAKGMVIVQCEQCKAWHKIADSQGMVEEYRFDNSDDE